MEAAPALRIALAFASISAWSKQGTGATVAWTLYLTLYPRLTTLSAQLTQEYFGFYRERVRAIYISAGERSSSLLEKLTDV